MIGFDRDQEHRKFLDWLLEQLSSHRPDALVIAGDIFDSVNPSSVAQKRYYQFLAESRAALPELQIIVTAGNHDAGSRLEAPSDLLESLKIHVVGTVQRDQAGEIRIDRFLIPVSPKEDRMEAIVMAVPFLRPSDVPVMSDAADPYLDGIRELYRRVTAAALEIRSARNPNAALIAMGHCHLHGGEESRQSERQIVIGGSESIGVDVFAPEIAYVALGHLHRAQQF
ncbi:MAG: exonuclease SbcCD subunit D, partial [Phycisphaerae bacterium]